MAGPDGFLVSRDEWEATQFLSPLVRCLYFTLRWLMDFRTGLVGVYPERSWQALTEWLYEQPGPGVKGGSPSRNQLRRAARKLVRVGLIEMRSSEAQRKLIFFLPMAKRGFFVPEQPDSKPTDQSDRPLQRGNTPKADRPRKGEADTHQMSVLRSNHHSISGDRDVVDNLEWSAALGASDRQMLTRMIRNARVNGSSQAIADEITAAIEKGAIRQGVVPYAGAVIARAKAGTFTRTARGLEVAARRASAAHDRRETSSASSTVSPASPARARAAIAEMTGKLKSKKAKR